MLEVIVLLFFSVSSLVVITYPLFQRTRTETSLPVSGSGNRLLDLVKKKEFLQQESDLLQFDFSLGKISDPDHEVLQTRFRKEIQTLEGRIADIEQAESESIDEAIEREVRSVREQKRKETGDRGQG
jgi:hypothetical protein